MLYSSKLVVAHGLAVVWLWTLAIGAIVMDVCREDHHQHNYHLPSSSLLLNLFVIIIVKSAAGESWSNSPKEERKGIRSATIVHQFKSKAMI